MDLSNAKAKRAGWATLFLVAVDAGLNAYSSAHSSPWTARNVATTPDKAKTCMEYVRKADILTLSLGAIGTFIAGNLWPLVGSGFVVIYMERMYRQAIKAAQSGDGVALFGGSNGNGVHSASVRPR